MCNLVGSLLTSVQKFTRAQRCWSCICSVYTVHPAYWHACIPVILVTGTDCWIFFHPLPSVSLITNFSELTFRHFIWEIQMNVQDVVPSFSKFWYLCWNITNMHRRESHNQKKKNVQLISEQALENWEINVDYHY